MPTVTRPEIPEVFLRDDISPATPVDATAEPQPAPEAEQKAKSDSLILIAESGDLEKTWATTILASSAAASGMKVTIFFTFWGFMALVKPERRTFGETWMQRMLSVMNRPGIDHLKLSRLNFLGMGPWMMGKLAKKYGVAKPAELLEMAMALGVTILPCQMSMDMFGLKREDLIDGVGEPVGAATVLAMIADGTPALFL
jgi:peroxiredoxin family protein